MKKTLRSPINGSEGTGCELSTGCRHCRRRPMHYTGCWLLATSYWPLATGCWLVWLAGLGLAGLYWWEVLSDGLAPVGPWQSRSILQLHGQFLSHALLLCLMTVATFIDFDEKTIPDTITVPGTLCGLFLAALLPASPLPVPHPDNGQVVTLLTTTPNIWPDWLTPSRGLLL